MKNNTTLLYLTLVLGFLLSSCARVVIAEPGQPGSSEQYYNEVAKEQDVPQDRIYYITNTTGVFGEEYLEDGIPFITFVRGDSSVSWKKIRKLYSEGSDVPVSCNLTQLSKELIEPYLDSPNQLKDVKIKQMTSGNFFTMESEETVAVLLYSDQLKYFVHRYLAALKALEEVHGIPYIILSMDGKERITDIEDIQGQGVKKG